ncbi:hypothetical protein [Halobacillus ihumii]|uniref:hypothetical protein n=1 Tax=Halobacillus ihumii TaxID=2686092 RepID=UPI0013D1F9BE|nr:hypothetical protein [Halobacillus ihumii]
MRVLSILKMYAFQHSLFEFKDGHLVAVQLEKLKSDQELLRTLNINPVLIRYFPLEVRPHLLCYSKGCVEKILVKRNELKNKL